MAHRCSRARSPSTCAAAEPHAYRASTTSAHRPVRVATPLAVSECRVVACAVAGAVAPQWPWLDGLHTPREYQRVPCITCRTAVRQ
jgi:hypothetical protein